MSLPEILVLALQDGAGLAEEAARDLAATVINWGAEQGHAGDRFYWPCRYRELTADERDEAIRGAFNGRNLKDVCLQYGVSHATVYRALRRA